MKIFPFSISIEEVWNEPLISFVILLVILTLGKLLEKLWKILKENGIRFYVPRFIVQFMYKPRKIFCKTFKTACTVEGDGCFDDLEPILNDLQAELIKTPTQVDEHYKRMRDKYFEMFSDRKPGAFKCLGTIEQFCEFLRDLFITYHEALNQIAHQYKNTHFKELAKKIDHNLSKIKEFFRKKTTPPTEPHLDWDKEWSSLCQFCKVRSEKRLSPLRKNGKYVVGDKLHKNFYIDRRCFCADKSYRSFDELLSSKRDTILIGKAGSGKTNEICKFVENHIYNHKNCVLFYTGSHLVNLKRWGEKPASLKSLIKDLIRLKKIGADSNEWADYDDLMEKINSQAEEEKQHFVIVVDAVNEFSDPEQTYCNPLDLCQHLIELSIYNRKKGFERVKLLLNMREETYKLLNQSKNKDRLKSSFAICELKDFSDEELENAYSLYKENSGIPTEFESLNEETKHLCREPFFLKLLCGIYSGKSLEGPFSKSKVFQEYYRKYVFSKDRTKSKLKKKTPLIPY